MASLEGHFGQNPMSTNQDGTNANGRAQAFLTTLYMVSKVCKCVLTVPLVVKDVSGKFLGARNGVDGVGFALATRTWPALSCTVSQKAGFQVFERLQMFPIPTRSPLAKQKTTAHPAHLVT